MISQLEGNLETVEDIAHYLPKSNISSAIEMEFWPSTCLSNHPSFL